MAKVQAEIEFAGIDRLKDGNEVLQDLGRELQQFLGGKYDVEFGFCVYGTDGYEVEFNIPAEVINEVGLQGLYQDMTELAADWLMEYHTAVLEWEIREV